VNAGYSCFNSGHNIGGSQIIVIVRVKIETQLRKTLLHIGAVSKGFVRIEDALGVWK
jgi:hypothetical protein